MMASDLPRSLGCLFGAQGGPGGSCFSAALWEQARWEDVGLSREIPVPQIGTTCATDSLGASFGLLQGNLAGLPPGPSCLCATLSTAPRFISRPAGLPMWAGGALLGVMFVMFPGSPSRKTSLKHRGFPSAGIQMNPKQSPLQSVQLMSRSLPPPRPGFRRALTMLRYDKGASFAF